jgi:cation diffusion facilitator CzcD-associated flavoprotein CzcO
LAGYGEFKLLEPDRSATRDDRSHRRHRELEVEGRPRWISPSYPGLIGNVLPEYLSFSHFPFPPLARSSAVQPFPTLQETHAYLRAVAGPFLATGKIRLNMEVVRVEELEDGGWRVVMKNWSTVPAEPSPKVIEERWDGVVISTGREGVIWPDCEGVDEVRTLGIGIHAKDYQGPAGHEGKVSEPLAF